MTDNKKFCNLYTKTPVKASRKRKKGQRNKSRAITSNTEEETLTDLSQICLTTICKRVKKLRTLQQKKRWHEHQP